jgi:hypothetical protein
MALLADQEKLSKQNHKLGLREKEVDFVLLEGATAVGWGPWIDIRAHHYKGIQVLAGPGLAGLVLNIEISNDGNTPQPPEKAAATNIAGGKFFTLDDACDYIRANITAISGGSVSVLGHGILES